MTDKSCEEIRAILISHAKKYPGMMPTDAVKLIYQNEFGGGHMIRDEKACLAYLNSEYESTPQDGGALTDDIGNGIVRVSLSALDSAGISPALLGKIFIESASRISGDLDSFKEKLSVLVSLSHEGIFEFETSELEDYLSEYAALGFPAVSHSESYRKLYRPSYRIVLHDLLTKYTEKEQRQCNL